jgi:hypothetical protein
MTNYQCPTNASLTDVLDRFVWLGCLVCFGLWEDSSPWPPPRAANRGKGKVPMLKKVLCLFAVVFFSLFARAEMNIPPIVRLTFPDEEFERLTGGNIVKFKADAFDPDGEVSEVRFYGIGGSEGPVLLGVATNAPFVAVWRARNPAGISPFWSFYAVARDNDGAESRSARVLQWIEREGGARLVISPPNGTIVAAGADFEFSVDRVVSAFDRSSRPVDIYFDDQLFRRSFAAISATSPPVSVVITNIVEGEHSISVLYDEGFFCLCPTRRVYAVKLGLREPVLRWDGRMEFELVTAYPGRETVIESSGNLADWTVYQRLVPQTNYVRFTVPPEESKRWFRAVLPEGVGE